MSDRRIRELERAYAEGQEPAVGAELLAALAQAGQLGPDAVELLALTGDPAAQVLVPPAAPYPADWVQLGAWIEALRMLDAPQAVARAAYAWLRRIRSLLLGVVPDGERRDALDAWLGDREQGRRAWILEPDAHPRPDWREGLRARGHAWGHVGGRALELLDLLTLAEGEFGTREDVDYGQEEAWTADLVWCGELVHAMAADLAAWAWGRDPLLAPGLELDALQIASPCEVSWESMTGESRVRSCGECQRAVFDLSALSRAEAQQLLAREGAGICVQLYRRPDGTVLTRDCAPGLERRLQTAFPASFLERGMPR